MYKILVLGVGNILLSDEGIGVHALQALQKNYRAPPDVELIDGGTCGMELLNPIAQTGHLILLDAVKTGQPPGTLVRLDNDEVPAFFRTKISPHQVGLSDVLAAAQLTGEAPERITLFGAEPESLAIGMELSPALAAQFPAFMAAVTEELARLGFPLEPVE